MDRYGLPTHWYQPPFSTVVHGYPADAQADDAQADAQGDAQADAASAGDAYASD